MNRGVLYVVLLSVVMFAGFAANGLAEEGGGPPVPPARQIPGITGEDMFPNACVDCHINRPDINRDVRISASMKTWAEKVDPKVLAKAQASAPEGTVLKGRHPMVGGMFNDIPATCLKCHGKNSGQIPPLSRMLHVIHLTGGNENHFMTIFQGECTHCHKLNQKTGEWSMPSAPEK